MVEFERRRDRVNVRLVVLRGPDGAPFVFAKALRDISSGEELLLDYGEAYWVGQRESGDGAELSTLARSAPILTLARSLLGLHPSLPMEITDPVRLCSG